MKLKWKGISLAAGALFLSPFLAEGKPLTHLHAQAVPLIPSPEPETLSLMVLGVLLIAGGAIARNWYSRIKD